MPIISRPYADDADYTRMRELLTEITAVGGDGHYCTVGDLDWWNAQRGDGPGAVRTTRLWFMGGGELIGFLWPGDGQADLLVHPGHRAIIDVMLDWAEEDWRATGAAEHGPLTFTTHSYDGDADRVARLQARGYQRKERALIYRGQSLDGALPAPPTPAGYTVRNMGGEDDLERRVAVHRAAFAPSRMTTAKYRAVMASQAYRPDLDLFAVAPDGSFASYCIIWFDTTNRIGVFEPVGTHPDHQRRGLSKAVLAEGLCRLRALGAQRAFVGSNHNNAASNALYQSVGFRPVDVDHDWTKAL